MILITGGAGFIGSLVAKYLYDAGHDLAIIDDFAHGHDGCADKWHNIRKITPLFVYDVSDPAHNITNILATINPSSIIHMGAISDTTASNYPLLWQRNIDYSMQLWHGAITHNIPFIYASSAATYGNGQAGFDAPKTCHDLKKYQPLNPYGWSKHVVDHYILNHIEQGHALPPFWAGLRFFNVYGPNEYHKGPQSSVIPRIVKQIHETGQAILFESHHADYEHGEQMRDFIYGKDCANIIINMLNNGTASQSGLYNCGTGTARHFKDVALSIFDALQIKPNIKYIPKPLELRTHYQYFTQAGTGNIAYNYTSLEHGINDYVTNHLLHDDVYC